MQLYYSFTNAGHGSETGIPADLLKHLESSLSFGDYNFIYCVLSTLQFYRLTFMDSFITHFMKGNIRKSITGVL